VGQRLFDVGIAASAHGFDSVKSMLKISGGDDDRVDVLVVVKLFVITNGGDGTAGKFVEVGFTGLATHRPDVGKSHDFEIESFAMLQKRREQTGSEAIGEADNADTDTVVGSQDTGVAGGGQNNSSRKRRGTFP
jgi:hypothetical protein